VEREHLEAIDMHTTVLCAYASREVWKAYQDAVSDNRRFWSGLRRMQQASNSPQHDGYDEALTEMESAQMLADSADQMLFTKINGDLEDSRAAFAAEDSRS
jgi:hypothetical protein